MTQAKIALVTGGNRGIGFEIVRQLAQMGITVILAARRLADAEYAAHKIATDEMVVVPIKLDVTDAIDIEKTSQFINDKFGRLDILINNSGALLDKGTQASLQELRDTFEINTIGPYILTERLLPLLKKSAAGRIVYQSSLMGSLTNAKKRTYGASPAYAASKAAMNMLCVLQAQHLKDTKIKVNAAHPGVVKTRMGGDDAPLSVTEGAKTAIRLALLDESGPNGGFFHMDEELPW